MDGVVVDTLDPLAEGDRDVGILGTDAVPLVQQDFDCVHSVQPLQLARKPWAGLQVQPATCEVEEDDPTRRAGVLSLDPRRTFAAGGAGGAFEGTEPPSSRL